MAAADQEERIDQRHARACLDEVRHDRGAFLRRSREAAVDLGHDERRQRRERGGALLRHLPRHRDRVPRPHPQNAPQQFGEVGTAMNKWSDLVAVGPRHSVGVSTVELGRVVAAGIRGEQPIGDRHMPI